MCHWPERLVSLDLPTHGAKKIDPREGKTLKLEKKTKRELTKSERMMVIQVKGSPESGRVNVEISHAAEKDRHQKRSFTQASGLTS